jgi:hypothetical protein
VTPLRPSLQSPNKKNVAKKMTALEKHWKNTNQKKTKKV